MIRGFGFSSQFSGFFLEEFGIEMGYFVSVCEFGFEGLLVRYLDHLLVCVVL